MAMFARQHYEAIAKAVAATHKDSDPADRPLRRQYAEGLADDLVALFRADNSSFRPHQFLQACSLD